MYRNWYWSWKFRSCHMPSEAIRVIPGSKVKKVFYLITSMFFPKWFWTFQFGRQNPRDKFISICLQQREFKQLICFQLLSTIFSFQSFGRFHLAPSPQKRATSNGQTPTILAPKARRRARSVASLHGASCSAAAARPPQSAGRLTSDSTTDPVTPMIRCEPLSCLPGGGEGLGGDSYQFQEFSLLFRLVWDFSSDMFFFQDACIYSKSIWDGLHLITMKQK